MEPYYAVRGAQWRVCRLEVRSMRGVNFKQYCRLDRFGFKGKPQSESGERNAKSELKDIKGVTPVWLSPHQRIQPLHKYKASRIRQRLQTASKSSGASRRGHMPWDRAGYLRRRPAAPVYSRLIGTSGQAMSGD
ncbi:hypothetical protein BS47DRAFT_1348166 [Hydnum rufescens UP504]|uniref:Uncharacterized protein n=1 Tax=Hydnum rufescens UP504 TaxID=1448309 RepID=A0A9P6DTA0_9AGAM|nr:hypothetical protein BS47DRAFT_1348166 [Hydnum rufescens UP504]